MKKQPTKLLPNRQPPALLFAAAPLIGAVLITLSFRYELIGFLYLGRPSRPYFDAICALTGVLMILIAVVTRASGRTRTLAGCAYWILLLFGLTLFSLGLKYLMDPVFGGTLRAGLREYVLTAVGVLLLLGCIPFKAALKRKFE